VGLQRLRLARREHRSRLRRARDHPRVHPVGLPHVDPHPARGGGRLRAPAPAGGARRGDRARPRARRQPRARRAGSPPAGLPAFPGGATGTGSEHAVQRARAPRGGGAAPPRRPRARRSGAPRLRRPGPPGEGGEPDHAGRGDAGGARLGQSARGRARGSPRGRLRRRGPAPGPCPPPAREPRSGSVGHGRRGVRPAGFAAVARLRAFALRRLGNPVRASVGHALRGVRPAGFAAVARLRASALRRPGTPFGPRRPRCARGSPRRLRRRGPAPGLVALRRPGNPVRASSATVCAGFAPPASPPWPGSGLRPPPAWEPRARRNTEPGTLHQAERPAW
jgi:hypothetical protein